MGKIPEGLRKVEQKQSKCTSSNRELFKKGGQVNSARKLIIYDQMVTAIDRCHRTDEVKQIRDKALALDPQASVRPFLGNANER